jgi:hypothetical protein
MNQARIWDSSAIARDRVSSLWRVRRVRAAQAGDDNSDVQGRIDRLSVDLNNQRLSVAL